MVIIGHLAAADETHGDAFAGRSFALGAENGARHQRRHAEGGSSGALEELAPGETRNSFHKGFQGTTPPSSTVLRISPCCSLLFSFCPGRTSAAERRIRPEAASKVME